MTVHCESCHECVDVAEAARRGWEPDAQDGGSLCASCRAAETTLPYFEAE